MAQENVYAGTLCPSYKQLGIFLSRPSAFTWLWEAGCSVRRPSLGFRSRRWALPVNQQADDEQTDM